jgi:tRNA threonylcarbamoyladenosine biosynthesis protein TsaB
MLLIIHQENLNLINMNPEKAILSIETSSVICGACLYFAQGNYFSSSINLKNSHSEKLLPMIDNLLRTANIQPDQIEAIAVSEGPGSFTGLRIGMAAAKGLAYGWKVPLIPVPTFEAIALEISHHFEDNLEFFIANNVNKTEVYIAKFQIKANNYIFVDDLQILDIDLLTDRVQDHKVFGNIQKNNKKNFSSPSPEFVALWAKQFGEEKKTMDFDYLEPNYLKSFIIKEKVK